MFPSRSLAELIAKSGTCRCPTIAGAALHMPRHLRLPQYVLRQGSESLEFRAFDSQAEYKQWLAEMGDEVRVRTNIPQFGRQTLWRRIQSLWRGPACAITFEWARDSLESTAIRRCRQCGSPNPPDAKFCQECGVPMFTPATAPFVSVDEPMTVVPDQANELSS